jgi:hypothetical protein
MKTARNKTSTRRPDSGGMFAGTELSDQLGTLEGLGLLARLSEATCEFTPLDRHKHIRQIALTVLHHRARRG